MLGSSAATPAAGSLAPDVGKLTASQPQNQTLGKPQGAWRSKAVRERPEQPKVARVNNLDLGNTGLLGSKQVCLRTWTEGLHCMTPKPESYALTLHKSADSL